MRKLFFLTLLAIGCSSSEKQPVEIRNLEQEFHTTETLPAQELCRIELLGGYNGIIIKDSVIFLNESTNDYFGRCVSINSGKEINKLLLKGKANSEMLHVDDFALFGDSLQAISGNHPRKLKLYSINDILQQIPPTPREVYLPDTLNSFYFSLIDESRVFGSLSYIDPNDDSKYFMFDGKELKYLGRIDKKLIETNIEPNYNDIRIGAILVKNQNGKLIVASTSAIQIEIIDIKTLEIENRCYFNKQSVTIKRDEYSTMISSKIDYRVEALGSNEKYIYLMYTNKTSSIVLKFDLNLTAIAKYKIQDKTRNGYFSENCEYLYGMSDDSNGETATLTKYKL